MLRNFYCSMSQKRSNIAVETLEPEMLSGFLRFDVLQLNDINKIYRYTLNKVLWKWFLMISLLAIESVFSQETQENAIPGKVNEYN